MIHAVGRTANRGKPITTWAWERYGQTCEDSRRSVSRLRLRVQHANARDTRAGASVRNIRVLTAEARFGPETADLILS